MLFGTEAGGLKMVGEVLGMRHFLCCGHTIAIDRGTVEQLEDTERAGAGPRLLSRSDQTLVACHRDERLLLAGVEGDRSVGPIRDDESGPILLGVHRAAELSADEV